MAAALCVGAAASAQSFKVEPQYPTDGDEVIITYDPATTPLNSSKQITGVIYFCDGQDWSVGDLSMTEENGIWRSSYVVPRGSVLFACKFYGDGDKSDSGAAAIGSYGMFVYDMSPEGSPIRKQHTWMQRSLLFSKSLDKFAVPGWLPEPLREDDGQTERIIRQELLSFPQSAPAMLYYVYWLKAKLGGVEEFADQMRGDFNLILDNAETPELQLVRASELARTALQDGALAEKLQAAALERFPNGLTARDAAIRKMFGEQDAAASLALLDEFVTRFPREKFLVPHTSGDDIYYYRIFSTVLRRQSEVTAQMIDRYLPEMPYQDVIECYYRLVYLPFSKQLRTANDIKPLAEVIFAELQKRINGAEDRFYAASRETRYSPNQWHRMMTAKVDNRDAIVTHAEILMNTGNAAGGLAIMEPLYKVLGSQNAGFNELYARLLKANGRPDIPFIEESVRNDAVSPAMIDRLRAEHKGADFDAYLSGLRSKDHVNAMAEELLGQMINTPVAEPFSMLDVEGKTVSLTDLKGKVVVLDFWATWCAPCLGAMPGMKMAEEKYKGNPNVVFYFVNTMERVPEMTPEIKREIADALAKRGFPDFKILFDSGSFAGLGEQFTMHGIPQKAVIDGNGNVRWVAGSYKGNPLELANEVMFVVDTVLAE